MYPRYPKYLRHAVPGTDGICDFLRFATLAGRRTIGGGTTATGEIAGARSHEVTGKHYAIPPSHSTLRYVPEDISAEKRLSVRGFPDLRYRRNGWNYTTVRVGIRDICIKRIKHTVRQRDILRQKVLVVRNVLRFVTPTLGGDTAVFEKLRVIVKAIFGSAVSYGIMEC